MPEIDSIKSPIIQGTLSESFSVGFKVVTHPSGVVARSSVADIEEQKAFLISEKQRIDEELTEIGKDLTNLI